MSFQTALSGLNAASRGLDVIGNNIANANTPGMKSARAEFADIVTASLGSGGDSGAGIGLTASTAQQFTQGGITITGNSLDVAVNGGGFFQEKNPDGSMAYTRAGDFKLDTGGFMVTNTGGKVMGYPTDKNGIKTSSTLTAMHMPTGAPIAASATANIMAELNLPTAATVAAGAPAKPGPPAVAAVPATPRSAYGTSLTTFDSQGTAVPVSLYFEKTATADTWAVYDSLTATTPIATLGFGTGGQLLSSVDSTSAATPTLGVLPITLTSSNGNIGKFSAKLDVSSATQFGTGFAVSNLTQDGYTAGELTKVSIGNTGAITATYSNGQTQTAGQVALTNFANVQGLKAIGGNAWIETYSSGPPVYGVAGEGRFGALQSGALEDSNVDLTAELVNMMTAQRAYQSNAQAIKTQDQIMSTLVNLR
jgi:flagellar hook protein FlgE